MSIGTLGEKSGAITMLGKLPAKTDSRTLRFKSYFMQDLKPPPKVDYTKAVKRRRPWPYFANDRHPCCTCSAAAHMVQVWTANAGRERILQDSAIVRTYRLFVGDVHKRGKHMLDVLNYWRHKGIGGDRILAYTQLTPQNAAEVKLAIRLFGACYIGVELPNFAVVPPTLDHLLETRWDSRPRRRKGEALSQRRNGHCMAAVKYDSKNLYVLTWGKLKPMSWKFYTTYVEEAYAVLSSDFVSKKNVKAPSGFDLAALKRDLRHLSRRNPAMRRVI